MATVTSPKYQMTGLTAGKAYALSVRAMDAVGNVSASSVTASASTLPPARGGDLADQ